MWWTVQLMFYPWVIPLNSPGALILTVPALLLRFTSPCISRPLRGARVPWRLPVTPWFMVVIIQVNVWVASPDVPMSMVTARWDILLLMTVHILPVSRLLRLEVVHSLLWSAGSCSPLLPSVEWLTILRHVVTRLWTPSPGQVKTWRLGGTLLTLRHCLIKSLLPPNIQLLGVKRLFLPTCMLCLQVLKLKQGSIPLGILSTLTLLTQIWFSVLLSLTLGQKLQ